MAKLREIYQFIDKSAPFALQMDFDNAGLLVGDAEAEICRILVALDVTVPVIQEAARKRCQLIVSHHPVVFQPIRALIPDDTTGVKLIDLTKRNIAVISAHTNLDLAWGGVNDVLLERLGLRCQGILDPMGTLPGEDGRPYGLGRIGTLPEAMPPLAFARMVKKALKARGMRVVTGTRPVKTVALCGGSGGDLIGKAAAAQCDALVTADVKYHQFLEAHQLGMTLVDGGHFATENPVVDVLRDRLAERFGPEGVEVLTSKASREVYFAV